MHLDFCYMLYYDGLLAALMFMYSQPVEQELKDDGSREIERLTVRIKCFRKPALSGI